MRLRPVVAVIFWPASFITVVPGRGAGGWPKGRSRVNGTIIPWVAFDPGQEADRGELGTGRGMVTPTEARGTLPRARVSQEAHVGRHCRPNAEVGPQIAPWTIGFI